MIAFTLEQLNGWIGQFIWPFVRILALVATAPCSPNPQCR